jgi:ribosomal protein S1
LSKSNISKKTKTLGAVSSVMEDLLTRNAGKPVGFSRSQKVQAKFIEIAGKSAIFDVGGKSEGVVKDLAFGEARDYIKTLKPGDFVQAIILDPETRDGYVLLSLRHAASDSLWDALNEYETNQTELSVTVKSTSNSGVVVDYSGVKGFIPMSQLGRAIAGNIDAFIGKTIKVKVAEINKDKRRVVFSEKYVSEAQELELQKEAQDKIKQGEVYEGVVTTLTDFGAFVAILVTLQKDGKPLDIQIEGLVHVSELSWDKVTNPATVLSIGDKVKVKALSNEGGKLALSIKQAQDDPWKKVAEKYHADDKVSGKVVRITEFGAIVSLEPGIEGLIHITKIPPAQKLKVGDTANCYIEEIDASSKKISLGLILSAKTMIYK